MDKQIDQKLESLLKYVPFIDYIVKIDSEKYVKFMDIKKWIVDKKRLPLSDLNKIEQSIITNYKNITQLVDMKMPEEIAQIFYNHFKHQYVNLCSDDEDSPPMDTKVEQDKQSKILTKAAPGGRASKKTAKVQSDSEDDIEIVSISYPEKSNRTEPESKIKPKLDVTDKKSSGSSPPPPPPPPSDTGDLDAETEKLLDQIDQITSEDIENHNNNNYIQPHNYHVVLSDDDDDKEKVLFQRRPRKDDCKPPVVANEENKPKRRCSDNPSTANVCTISLDSSDDEDETIQKTQENDFLKNTNNQDLSLNISKTVSALKSDNIVEPNQIAASASSAQCSSSSNLNYETENLSNDEMCRLIESEVKSLDTNQLQSLLKQIFQKGSAAEPVTPSVENGLSSPSGGSDSKQNETPLCSSPAPPAPRIESVDSPDKLLKALYDFLEKAQKTVVNANTIEAPRNSGNYEKQPNIVPFTPTTQQHQHQHPHPHHQQQQLNFYNNPAMQTSMHQQCMPQPMYPHAFAPFNQHVRTANNPGFTQTFASAQASLKSRDPRAKSALYQNSLKIIEAEMAKRNGIMQRDNVHQPHIAPVLLSNNSSAEIIQPIQMSSPTSAQQQTLYRMSTGITQSKPQTFQQLYGAHGKNTNIPAQASQSAGTKTKRATLTYGEYKRRKSEEQHKKEKQREEEKRRQEAWMSRTDGVPYGENEYKRRQAEDQRIAEILREEEKIRLEKQEELLKRQVEAIKAKETEELETKEAEKKRSDLHSILFSALRPYEDKIEKVWNSKKDPDCNGTKPEPSKDSAEGSDGKQERKLPSGEKENANDVSGVKKRKIGVLNDEIDDKCKQPPKDKSKSKKINTEVDNNEKTNKSDKSKSDEQKERINNRINRLFKEMECTFKGYEQLPKTIGGKRRSSLHARTVISKQLNNSQESETQGDNQHPSDINTQNHSSHAAGKKRQSSMHSRLVEEDNTIQHSTPPIRRSSIHARSAIAEQLNSQSSLDSTDNYTLSANNISPSSSSTLSLEPKKRNHIEATKNNLGDDTNCVLSSDSEMNDFERFRSTKVDRFTEAIIKRQPKVLLRRITADEIKRHAKAANEKPKAANILNVRLIESGIRPDTTTNVITKTSATTSKKSPLKKCNNDCQMTERTTKFCALCSSKPSDLTNHYKRKHKCESYVSRLTWSELDELCINTPFATLVPSTNSRIERYSVLCPFCDEKLLAPFMHLYNHYASHTGEYAFQCAACQLDKPFRADIQSHQLHSKTCRNSQIQTMYRYPSNTMSIYLHYCTICNFVQLNEANILKHLREHHDARKSTSENVKKCILAAISDGPESNAISTETQLTNPTNTNITPSQTNATDNIQDVEMNEPVSEKKTSVVAKAEIDLNLDDNIPVFNEACAEEAFDLEERLREMHEGQSCSSSVPHEPMTIIHMSDVPELGRVVNKPPSRHLPKVFKTEVIDFGENSLQTPTKPSTVSNKSYTKNISSYSIYRPFPANVNYLGFYKCMAGDCFYSSDGPEEFIKHLEDHQQENLPEKYLLCSYCIIPASCCQSVQQLVDHIRTQHSHLLYQCSMCCYRSCEASNVLIHQNESHPSNAQDCTIYKCSGTELPIDTNYIRENMCESVAKVQCPYCSNSTYNTMLLMQHIITAHKIVLPERIQRYSCVYCYFSDKDKSVIRKHMAINHPGELPFLCDHNSSTVTEDSLHNLEPINLAQSVPFTVVPSTYDTVVNDIPPLNSGDEDIKPSVEELIRCQAETAKIRLRKLTEKTGIAPDCLYRCPEQACGGFFSNYDLWLRHMKLKHKCLEITCPHCPTQTTKTLEDFKLHFEEHRRHTYICFHCPWTSVNSMHAQDHWLREHRDLGTMHVEQIRFNLNYSYYIMIQSNKFNNQPELLTNFCDVFDCRIKDLEKNEATKLKRKWLVIPNSTTLWLEDYPKNVMSPKLVKKCFNGNCNFRTKSDETLFSHVRSNHDICGSIFKCSKCDFRLENSSCWDDALNHIKQHSETSFFICAVCSNYYLCRSKLSDHVRSEHTARDVPIVNLLKTGHRIYARIEIVFANERLTFSTMHNCFCCEERNMKGNALMLHLKRYHNFVLNYFCEWCNLPIESLQAVEKHFQQNHTTNKLKIRCELASKADLSILSIKDFQIQISLSIGDQSAIFVKEEPDADDSVIIVEDDDVIAENFVKTQNAIEETAEKPKLKCIAMESLLNPGTRDPTASQNAAQLRILPRVKIVQKRLPSVESPLGADQLHALRLSNKNTIASDSIIQPNNITDSVISSQRVTLPPSDPNNQTSVSNSIPNTNAINIQPYTNTHNPSNNMVSPNQYGPVYPAGLTKAQFHTHPSVPGIDATSSLRSVINAPHSYYTTSIPQSVVQYGNSSHTSSDMQSVHAKNLHFAQGPMTTSFLNSHHVPTQTTAAAGITNAQPQHNVTFPMSNKPNSYIPTGYTNIQGGIVKVNAQSSHTVSTILSTKPTSSQTQLYVQSPQIQAPHCAVINTLPPSSGHTMHPNSTTSVSYSKY